MQLFQQSYDLEYQQGLNELKIFIQFAWKHYHVLDPLFYFKSSSQWFRYQIIKHQNQLQLNKIEVFNLSYIPISNGVVITPKKSDLEKGLKQLSQIKQTGLPESPFKSETKDNKYYESQKNLQYDDSENKSQNNSYQHHSDESPEIQSQKSDENQMRDQQDQFNNEQEIQNDENNKNESDLSENEIQQQIVIEQQEIIKNIKIRYHQDEERQAKVTKILEDLLKASSGKRAVDIQLRPYLRDRLNFQEMCQNYNLNLPSKKEIKKICNGMIIARGDGNCFYTAFGYQFLNILICQYSNDEYDNFIDEIEKLNLNLIISHPDFQEYDQETGKELLNEFLFRIQSLRMIGNNQERENQLFNQFQEYEIGNNGKGCLSVLSTIFFRNLSNLVLDSSELKDQVFDRVNLLIWEQECNNNEIIIQCLAQFCQITVVLLYMENQTFVENRYNDGKQKQIILLIRPGHYNIGLFQ